MKLKSAQDVIAVARERGFDVRLNPGPPPMPVLHMPAGTDRKLATDTLIDALKAWRLEIIEELTPDTRLREWLWESGNYYPEGAHFAAYKDKHPQGAAWWKYQDETEWHPLVSGGKLDVALRTAEQRFQGKPWERTS